MVCRVPRRVFILKGVSGVEGLGLRGITGQIQGPE